MKVQNKELNDNGKPKVRIGIARDEAFSFFSTDSQLVYSILYPPSTGCGVAAGSEKQPLPAENAEHRSVL